MKFMHIKTILLLAYGKWNKLHWQDVGKLLCDDYSRENIPRVSAQTSFWVPKRRKWVLPGLGFQIDNEVILGLLRKFTKEEEQ